MTADDRPMPTALAISQKALSLYFDRMPLTAEEVESLQLGLLAHALSPKHTERTLRQTGIARQILADISRSIILRSNTQNAETIIQIEDQLNKLMSAPYEKHKTKTEKAGKKRRNPQIPDSQS